MLFHIKSDTNIPVISSFRTSVQNYFISFYTHFVSFIYIYGEKNIVLELVPRVDTDKMLRNVAAEK